MDKMSMALEGKEKGTRRKKIRKKECIVRESNTGLVDGNDEFYH